MGGDKILAGLRDALAFSDGDRLAGRVLERNPDGGWDDVSARWLTERGMPSKRPDLRIVEDVPTDSRPPENR